MGRRAAGRGRRAERIRQKVRVKLVAIGYERVGVRSAVGLDEANLLYLLRVPDVDDADALEAGRGFVSDIAWAFGLRVVAGGPGAAVGTRGVDGHDGKLAPDGHVTLTCRTAVETGL